MKNKKEHSPSLVDKKKSPPSPTETLLLSLGHGGRSNSIHQNTILRFFFIIITFSLKPNTPPPPQPQLCLTPLLKFLIPPPSQPPNLQIPQ